MIRRIQILVCSSAVVEATIVAQSQALSAELGLPVDAQLLVDVRAAAAHVQEIPPGEGLIVCADRDLAGHDQLLAAVEQLASPLTAWVDLHSAAEPRKPALANSPVWNIRGRGLEGNRWAARTLLARSKQPWSAIRYGEHREQVGDLRLPASGPAPFPVACLIHGGAWRERWERDLMDELAVDLADRGYATWNVEYRRVGVSGGGWPTTFEDVAAAIDAIASLADRHPLDPSRVALVGHSAGGHLAMWAAARGSLPAGAFAAPVVIPAAVLSLAGVLDIAEMARRGNEEGATTYFMGGAPREVPERYAVASPASLVPIPSCLQLVAYGTADRIDLIDNNRRYCALARAAGDSVIELPLDGADHFHVIDPRAPAWQAARTQLEKAFPAARRTTEADVVRAR